MTDRPLNLAIFDMGLLKAPFFLGLREPLAPTIRCLYWSRRLLMRRYAQSAGIPIFPAALAEPAVRSRISDDQLRRALGSKIHKLRRTVALDRPRRRLAEIETFLDEQAVDALLVWNGSNPLLSLAIHAARQRGITVIFVEHGYFPGTLQLDLEGVNHASSLSRRVRDGTAQRPPEPRLDARLDAVIGRLRGHAPSRVVRSAVPPQYLQTRQARLMNAVFYRLRPYGLGKPLFPVYRDPPLPTDGFVFYPLQVVKDSQLLLHSPIWGNDHAAVIAALCDGLARLPSPRRLVVKFHPQETRLAQIRHEALIRQFPQVIFVCNVPASDLIQRARFVVTINSSVGFEALLLDKPLVTLGDSFYAVPSLAEVVGSESELDAALHRADALPVRTEARRALLRHCMTDFFSFGTYFDHRPQSYAAIADRIRALLVPAATIHARRIVASRPSSLAPAPWTRPPVLAFEESGDRRGAGSR